MSEILDELKKEASELGISYSSNIGEAALQKKIEAFYASQETSGKELLETVMAKEAKEAVQEKSEEKSAVTDKELKKAAAIRENKKRALQTQVISIIDNDPRVNNQTTTCIVNCSNMYFDLGTLILPLNTPVEVAQGHINVIKEMKMPQHVKDNKTGLSAVRLVPRYTVSYESMR